MTHQRRATGRTLCAAIGVASVTVLGGGALAQTRDDRQGFALREVSLSSGYSSVQLPPVTLGGYLPNDILSQDLVTSATAQIEWRRVTPRTAYSFELLGVYTTRARHSELNTPGADVAFGVSRAVNPRWRLGAGGTSAVLSSNQLTFHPTRTRRLVNEDSFDDLAGTAPNARTTGPELNHASMFGPIRQSLVESDLYMNRILVSTAVADATYVHSVKLATVLHGKYATVRPIGSDDGMGRAPSFSDSNAYRAGLGLRYNRSERTQITTAIDWSHSSGVFRQEGLSATLRYAWSGQRWFMGATAGTFIEPGLQGVGPSTDSRGPKASLIYSGTAGYKFRSHTLLVEYSRAPHDQYGSGGRNVSTGFEGDVESLAGSWSWLAPRSHWVAQTDFSMIRRPGNFSTINAWLATAGLGRRVGPGVHLVGEFVFDRHGSRGFEGFHLTRTGARLNLVWAPSRRRVEPGESDR